MPRRNEQAAANNANYKKDLAVAIGRRIRQRRDELQIEQKDLRARLELKGIFISRSELSRIEQGQSLPDAAEIVELARALNVSCEWLLISNAVAD